MPKSYAGFTEHKRRASEQGIELYLLDHPATCTIGKCANPAIVNGAWLYPQGTGKWICNNYCEQHLEFYIKHGPCAR